MANPHEWIVVSDYCAMCTCGCGGFRATEQLRIDRPDRAAALDRMGGVEWVDQTEYDLMLAAPLSKRH